MTRYATPADVETERADTDAPWSDVRVAALVDDAHDLAALGRDLPARIAAGRTTVGLVRRVLLEVVTAALRNPAGLRSQSCTEAAGPFTAGAAATHAHDGRLGLTREHRRLLGDRMGGISTVAPGQPSSARTCQANRG